MVKILGKLLNLNMSRKHFSKSPVVGSVLRDHLSTKDYGLMEKILNTEKGKTVCIIPPCDALVGEYGLICEGHRVLLEDKDLKVIICDNCGSIARIVEPQYSGNTGQFWKRNLRKKYVFCEICRNCGATREEEVYSTYIR